MRFRLTHVLVLMALILAAGVISVQQLEARRGAITVPGVIAVDAPWLDVAAAQALLRATPAGRYAWVAADPTPLSPFGAELAARRVAQGARTLLVAPLPDRGPAIPLHDFGSVLDGRGDELHGAAPLAALLAEQAGSVPFLAVLPLPLQARPRLQAIVTALVTAAEDLPSFRRTSVVVLGVHEPESGRRLALRFDRGRWPRAPHAGLVDLLEENW